MRLQPSFFCRAREQSGQTTVLVSFMYVANAASAGAAEASCFTCASTISCQTHMVSDSLIWALSLGKLAIWNGFQIRSGASCQADAVMMQLASTDRRVSGPSSGAA